MGPRPSKMTCVTHVTVLLAGAAIDPFSWKSAPSTQNWVHFQGPPAPGTLENSRLFRERRDEPRREERRVFQVDLVGRAIFFRRCQLRGQPHSCETAWRAWVREAGCGGRDQRRSLRPGAFASTPNFSRAARPNTVATGSMGLLKWKLKSIKMK